MRVCVISDTHRHRHELLTAVKLVQPVDAIWHLGDEVSDARWLALRVDWPVLSVAGNWDVGVKDAPLMRMENLGFAKVLLVHGHALRVKEGLDGLYAATLEFGADAVCFGHTHAPMGTVVGGRLMVNPGSLAEPRGQRERTFVLLETVASGDSGTAYLRATHLTLHGTVQSQVSLVLDGRRMEREEPQ